MREREREGEVCNECVEEEKYAGREEITNPTPIFLLPLPNPNPNPNKTLFEARAVVSLRANCQS